MHKTLIFAPYRQDAALLGTLLGENGIDHVCCADIDELVGNLPDCTAAIVTQEALRPQTLDALGGALAAQPPWSELPIVLLLDGAQRSGPSLVGLEDALPQTKLTILQRPVRVVELLTAVQAAVAARRRQFELRDHIALQEELQRELNHRVKNTLANVYAIYHLTRRQSDSLEDFAERFEGRLNALSRVHAALVMSNRPRSIADIAELVLAPYRSHTPDRIQVDQPPLMLESAPAVAFALSLHELATNAAKYGALSTPTGQVELHCASAPDADGAIRITWQESGGPAVEPPTRRGYGTAYVRSAVKGTLRGTAELEFLPGGLRCVMSIPLSTFAAMPDGVEAVASLA